MHSSTPFLFLSLALAALPAVAAPPSKPANIVTDFKRDAELCTAMLVQMPARDGRPETQLRLPSDAEADLAAAAHVDPGNFSTIRSLNHFDLGDDDPGAVFGLHQRSQRDYSDTYFFGADAALSENWREAPEYLFHKESDFVFPNSFASMDHSCRDELCDARYSIQQSGNKQKPFAYRIRYLQVTPFEWRETTYFLLTTADAAQRHLASVVLPRKSLVADEICLFRQENGEAIELAP